MQRDTHGEQLRGLGLDDESYRALVLLPAIKTAWTHGRIVPDGRAKVLDVGRSAFRLNESAMGAVQRWLERPLTDAFYKAGFHVLRRLTEAVDEPLFDYEMLHAAMSHAEAVARANNQHGPAAGAPWALSTAERETLLAISAALGIDHGESWAGVMDELNDSVRFPRSRPRGSSEAEVDDAQIASRFETTRKG